MDYLKVGKATELTGRDRRLYRLLEIAPGFLSWSTLLLLIILSYFKPIWVAYFIIAFDVYWLLLVIYLGILLLFAYFAMQKNVLINWRVKCNNLSWQDIHHLIIFPTYKESLEIIKQSFQGLLDDGYPTEKMIVILAVEAREGKDALVNAKIIEQEYGNKFKKFLITIHPDNIVGELKGKGANQAWAAKEVKEKIIDKENYDYNKILVSVFDIDTVVFPGYFFCLTYKFLTTPNPYKASYQPIPIYHNNIWQAYFFARVAAASNTFWQMMQQIRQEKLATYSSHSMTWRALVDINFWSTNMVSEDSRIFWHSLCYYKGDYRVEPLYFPVSMDICMDKNIYQTMKNLYKQQRRWGWGVENVPYLIFNVIKNYKELPIKKMIGRIFIQLYGFHSWATNALIIGIIGWLPIIFGGNQFNNMVLSNNLPTITRTLMIIAMIGLVFSAIISTILLPKRPSNYGFSKNIIIILQWLILPITIIIFGAIPSLEAQTRLMLGKYMGYWVTPKSR
ncbi:MAG: glycosyltransferase family 2 protein [Patescibacteria group bacterium]|nr:glycosyltransferase family 2 protein [Patescibacteria group bacterium]MBU1871101.1 glycosyltransferase family 2 protein [Patescibacteria group bacterium]